MDRVQCDKEVEIKEKLKQIIIEKSRLKMLGQNGSTPQVAKEPVKMPQSTKKEDVYKLISKPTPNVTTIRSSDQVEPKVENEKLKIKDNIFGAPINSIEKHSTVAIIEPIEIKSQSSQEKPVRMETDDVEVVAEVSKFYLQIN